MIQGNLLMDSNKITGYRALGAPGGDTCTGPKYSKADNNTFRDNIVAFGEGSGLLIGENMQGTQVLNNVIMDVQNGGVQIKGNNPGNNTIQHNSFVVSKLDSTYDSINAECYDQNGNFVGSDYSHSDILKIIEFIPIYDRMCLYQHDTMTGGTSHGWCTVHRWAGPPHSIPGFHQSDPRGVSDPDPAV